MRLFVHYIKGENKADWTRGKVIDVGRQRRKRGEGERMRERKERELECSREIKDVKDKGRLPV